MSASDKKKLRKEEKQEKLTQRQQAAKKEERKTKITTAVFTVIICLFLVIGIGLLAYQWYENSGISERNTTAVVIGDHELSVADLNYYYMDILNETSQDWYGMYLLQLEEGFNSSVALDQQKYHDEDRTWADYFIERAVKEASAILSLTDSAKKEGYTLTEAEKNQLEETMKHLEEHTMAESGYSDLDDFLKAVYGRGADEESYRKYLETKTLAQSYATYTTSGMQYTAEQIADKEKEVGSYSNFTYISFDVEAEEFLEHTTNEDGEEEHNHSEEEMAEAVKKAEQIAKELVASGATNKEDLDKAIASLPFYNPNAADKIVDEESAEGEKAEDKAEEKAEEETSEKPEATEPTEATTEPTEATTEPTEAATEPTEGAAEATGEATEPTEDAEEEETTPANVPTSTENPDMLYSIIDPAIGKWLLEEGRKEGDIGMVPMYALDEEGEATEEITGYTVVIFGSEDIQDGKTVSVRHVLISFEGGTEDEETGSMVYSEKEKNAAKKEADKILNEWLAGEKTEESFGELAKKYTDDSNACLGGLYDMIYEGWAVESFDKWCFDSSRKPGDTGMVETEYGYHVIYFVDENEEDYRDYLIINDLRTAESEEWYNEHRDTYFEKAKMGDTSAMRTDIIFNSAN